MLIVYLLSKEATLFGRKGDQDCHLSLNKIRKKPSPGTMRNLHCNQNAPFFYHCNDGRVGLNVLFELTKLVGVP